MEAWELGLSKILQKLPFFISLDLLLVGETQSGFSGHTSIKYIKEKSFWDVRIPSNCSWGWRGILSKIEIVLKHVTHIIGNGQNTDNWSDPWLPGGRIKDIYGDRPRSDIIENGVWKLPIPTSRRTSSHLKDTFQLIQAKENPSVAFTNQIIWTAVDNGQFSLQFAVEILNDHRPVTTWFEVLWFKGMIPKHSIYLWMALQNGLKTKMLLSSKLVVYDTSCTLCHPNVESCLHLFGECPYSTKIWVAILRKFRVTSI